MAGEDPNSTDSDIWDLLTTHPRERVDGVKKCIESLVAQLPESMRVATNPNPGREAAHLLAKMRVDPVAVGAAVLSDFPLGALFPRTPRAKKAALRR